MFSTLTSARRATEISLERQFFYTPPAAADPKLASRGFRAQERDPSATTSGVPSYPTLPQDVHDPQSGDAGKLYVEVILIPSDDEFDLDSRSDISFGSLGGLLSEARNPVQPSRISGTGKGVDATSDDYNAPEPSASSMAGPGNESHASPITLHAEQDRPVLVFPASDPSPVCVRWSRIPVDRCPKHPNGSTFCRRFLTAKADDKGNKADEPKPADAGLPLPLPNSQLEADHTTDEMCPATPPPVVQSWARTPTLPDDESTSELEPAAAEPRLQPQSRCGTASSRGFGPQRSSSSHLSPLSRHRGHRDGSDHTVAESNWLKPAADPHRRSQSPHNAASSPGVETQQWSDPSVQDDGGGQNEGFVAPSRAQEIRASMPRLLVEGSNAPEPAHAEPSMQPSASPDQANGPSDGGGYGPVADSVAEHGQDDDVAQPPRKRRGMRTSTPTTNAEPSMQPPASQVGVKRHRDLGRHRHDSTDDGGDYCPGVYSDTEHSEDEAVRPPRRKRCRASAATYTAGGTAPQQQTRPDRSDSLREAWRQSQRPRRQRSATHLSSSREPSLERDTETDRGPAATFEEWPLGDTVLKRVTMDGSPPTFMVQFTWDQCAEHATSEEWPLGDAVLKRVTTDGSLPTFMVQFTWDPCAEHGAEYCGTENRGTTAKRHRPARRSNKITKHKGKPTSTSRRARYTPADDAKILWLKGRGLSWVKIAEQFPGRSAGAIQVRYHTKLKTTDPSRSESRQLCDDSRALSPVVGDDSGDEEWGVEEICGHRRRDDGGLELLVKWEGGEETWQPYKNVAEAQALDKYERLHGRVTVDIVRD